MAVDVERTSKPPPPAEPAPVSEPPGKPRLWRRICVALLLIFGFILTPVAVLVTYAKTQVLDTDRYVATVKPLAKDPAVQNYIADTVTTNLLAQVDVKALVNDSLPPRAGVLAGPLSNALQGFVHETTLRFVQSNAFERIWVGANRVAHAQVDKVLTNKGGAVTVQKNGAVKVDLKGVAGAVQKQLIDQGLTVAEKIPLEKVNGSITIFQSEDLYKARKGAQLLDTVGYALPFVVFACLGGAVLLSVRKRRGFIKAAFAFAAGAVVLALVVNAARHVYLDSLPTTVPHDAAAAFFDTLLRSLHASVRNILLVSLVVFVAAFLSGPSHPAVAFRNWWARVISWAGGGDHAGWGLLYASPWVARNKRLLRIILAVVLFVVAFRWSHPTLAVLLWLSLLGVVGLVLIDFYGRPPAKATLEAAGKS
jgi:hypothetical protein